jgi:hypothetical protein
MTYSFPQFNVQIVNPTIFINLNTIQDKAIDKLLSVLVVLSTDTAQFGVIAEDMPYVNTWDDDDIPAMVNNWLIQFEV